MAQGKRVFIVDDEDDAGLVPMPLVGSSHLLNQDSSKRAPHSIGDREEEALDLLHDNDGEISEQEEELSVGVWARLYQALIKFKNTVLTPVFNWFLNTHVSTIVSTYTIYQSPAEFTWHSYYWNLKKFFRNAFPFDGLDIANNTVTTADGKAFLFYGNSVPWSVWIVAFLGLPSRLESLEGTTFKFSFLQFLRNLVGGLNPLKETLSGPTVSNSGTLTFSQRRWTEKKIVLAILFVFKLFVIAPIKLITFPFKFLFNVVKLVTEVLLPFVSLTIALISGLLITGVKGCVASLVGYRPRRGMRSSSYNFSPANIFYIFPLIVVLALAVVSSVIQYALMWVCRVALAITSPATSFRKAYKAGRALDTGEKDSKFLKTVSYILGYLGAAISLAVSAFSWMLLLPLALGGLVTVFPSVLSAITWVAQLPFVTTSLAWLSQWPVITGSAALVNSFFGIVGGGLASVFGSAVTALAALISVQIPATVLTVGMTLGLIFMPVAAVASRGLDVLSDLWAKWVEQAPFAAIFNSKAKKGGAAKGRDLESDSAIELRAEPLTQPLVGYVLSPEPPKQPSSERGFSEDEDNSSDLYVYQPLEGGFYIASSQALYLVRKKKESEAEVNQLLEGIILRGEKAQELRDRAENASQKGLRTQGVRFATTAEERGSRENPVVPEGISADVLRSAKPAGRLEVPSGEGITTVFRPSSVRPHRQ